MSADYTHADSLTDQLIGMWPLWGVALLAALGWWQWRHRRVTPAEVRLHRYIRRIHESWWEYGLEDPYGNTAELGHEPTLDAAVAELYERTCDLGQNRETT